MLAVEHSSSYVMQKGLSDFQPIYCCFFKYQIQCISKRKITPRQWIGMFWAGFVRALVFILLLWDPDIRVTDCLVQFTIGVSLIWSKEREKTILDHLCNGWCMNPIASQKTQHQWREFKGLVKLWQTNSSKPRWVNARKGLEGTTGQEDNPMRSGSGNRITSQGGRGQKSEMFTRRQTKQENRRPGGQWQHYAGYPSTWKYTLD